MDHQGATDGQHLCSPPDATSALLEPLLRRGNRSNTTRGSSSYFALPVYRTPGRDEIFNRSTQEKCRPSGQWAEALPTMASTAAVWMCSPFHLMVPEVGPHQPGDGLSVVVFAGAVSADHATISPISTLNKCPSIPASGHRIPVSVDLSMPVPPADIGFDHHDCLDFRRRPSRSLAEVEHRDAAR